MSEIPESATQSSLPKSATVKSEEDDSQRLQAKAELVSFLQNYLTAKEDSQDGEEAYSFEMLGALPEAAKLIGAHAGLLVEALSEVPSVIVDGARKRVVLVKKPQRNTIILRSIKANENEVRGIFDVDGAPGKATKVRPDIGETWFVSFDTEEIAVETLLWIRSQQFQGNPIRARMKSETQQKGFYADIPLPFVRAAPNNNNNNNIRRNFAHAPHNNGSSNGLSADIIHYSKDFILDVIKTVKVTKPNMAECEAVCEEPNLKLDILPDEDLQPRNPPERAKDGHPHADAPEYIPQSLNPALFQDFRTKRPRPNLKEKSGDDLTFGVDVEAIAAGQDHRTTLMIKNIPNKYSQRMLLQSVEETNKGSFDFIYLPIDFRNWCNVGYAFINFLTVQDVASFYQAFHGQKWKHFKSEKICQITYARIQGKDALIDHFARSRLLSEDKRCRPMILVEGKLVPLTRRFWVMGNLPPNQL